VGHRGGNGVAGVDNWSSVDNGSSVDDGADGVGNRVGNSDSLGVGSGTIVGDLGDVTVDGVGVVVHVLDPAVGKGNRVGALSVAGTVAALSGVEV